MTKHLPPIPPESRSPKGPGDHTNLDPNANTKGGGQAGERNLALQGRQGNTKQNTTHQGYQQDR
jgi:hypothetical protein